jgi:hypothetical protein
VNGIFVIPLEKSFSFFASFKILAIYTLAIFRAQYISLEALAVLLEATRLLAVAPFIMLPY